MCNRNVIRNHLRPYFKKNVCRDIPPPFTFLPLLPLPLHPLSFPSHLNLPPFHPSIPSQLSKNRIPHLQAVFFTLEGWTTECACRHVKLGHEPTDKPTFDITQTVAAATIHS